MIFVCIEPTDQADHDQRTFECSTCPYAEVVAVKYRSHAPMELDWPNQKSEGPSSNAGGGWPFLSSFQLLNLVVGSTHKLGFASLISDFAAPLPFQPSPLSSSRAKQLGW
jgi:hypothetical protein